MTSLLNHMYDDISFITRQKVSVEDNVQRIKMPEPDIKKITVGGILSTYVTNVHTLSRYIKKSSIMKISNVDNSMVTDDLTGGDEYDL